ncbi:MAG: hypothetical protein PHV82_03195 [Victivallaceae bacterium]|nr:hypothetical protein [Victivallaceae bacterium]
MRKVPDIAAVEIARLRKLGIKLSDDDVVWLSCLGYQVENPNGQTLEASGIIDGILLSDGTYLRPLTIRASRWLSRYGPYLYLIDDTCVVAYAMAVSGALSLDRNVLDVFDDVSDWVNTRNITQGELERAVARLLASDTPHKTGEKKTDISEIIGFLVGATGLPAEYWDKSSWDHLDCVNSGVLRYASILAGTAKQQESAASRAALKNFALAIQEITKREAKKDNG